MILSEPPTEPFQVDGKIPHQAALRRFQIGAAALAIAFALPLWNLVKLALHSEIHSHTLLIPLVVAFLWRNSAAVSKGGVVTQQSFSASKGASACAAVLGAIVAACSWMLRRSGTLSEIDAISLSITAFLLLLLALALATLGWSVLRPRLFAVCFAVFFIPLPGFAVEGLSVLLQKASAEAADVLLSLANIPQLRDGMVFKLPTLTIQVAEECSGIRSTFALFMTSLIAGHMFLRRGWKKALLALAVFPLGILRNAFRITLLSWLSVNVDAGAIDSALHHRGGPIFFALSLIPLFVLLWLFRRSDRRQP
jgi:exosortase C (VPDSG-CTERM-specific)